MCSLHLTELQGRVNPLIYWHYLICHEQRCARLASIQLNKLKINRHIINLYNTFLIQFDSAVAKIFFFGYPIVEVDGVGCICNFS
jgi:hypothetical protein